VQAACSKGEQASKQARDSGKLTSPPNSLCFIVVVVVQEKLMDRNGSDHDDDKHTKKTAPTD